LSPQGSGSPGALFVCGRAYERFVALVNERAPLELRDLLEPAAAGPAVPLDELEPAESILRRFSGGAMSHGALSAEAHETVAIALNSVGARANTGEGGEDPGRYRNERNSAIKQVASGGSASRRSTSRSPKRSRSRSPRARTRARAGSSPGHKVTAELARLRPTQPGVALISPPPHHDIYSIEDPLSSSSTCAR
jgi:glutamate synthase domain-containing protein 2